MTGPSLLDERRARDITRKLDHLIWRVKVKYFVLGWISAIVGVWAYYVLW